MNHRKEKAISGVKWMAISTFTTASVAVLRLSILTRFLEKSDFGLVALLTMVLGLTQTFADLGFSSAMMHKKKLSTQEFSSLYWIQLMVFFIFYGLISSGSYWFSVFYEEEMLQYLLPLSLLDLLFYGIGRLYDTILQKELRFRTMALRNMICAGASLGLAVLLAMMGCGIYSLILSTLFQTFMNNLWNAIAGQTYYPLRFFVSFKLCLPLMKIGGYQMGTQIVDYFSAKCDVLIIGKLLGAESLGIYALAKELAMKVVLLINSIVNRVSLPFFSMYQDQMGELRKMYIQVLKWLALIDFPICMVLCVLSTPLVKVLYGEDFLEVAPILSILSIWSLCLCIGNPMGNLSIAKGRTDLSFKYTLVRVCITFPMVYVFALFTLSLVAWGQILIGVVLLGVGYRLLLYKLIDLPWKRYVASFGKIGFLTLCVGMIVALLFSVNPFGMMSDGFLLLIYGLIFIFLYIGLLWAFDRNLWMELFVLLKS